jgi:malonyl CoA-acyl carrier protein transacylase
MLANGADWFMEVGPGTVLQGLVRRISGGLVNIEGIQ